MTTPSYPSPTLGQPGWTPKPPPPNDTYGDHWLIALGVLAFGIAVILGIIGASQDTNSYDYDSGTQAALFGWGTILGSLGFFLTLLGTIIRAGKIAAGRR
jgi:hypothetical protein